MPPGSARRIVQFVATINHKPKYRDVTRINLLVLTLIGLHFARKSRHIIYVRAYKMEVCMRKRTQLFGFIVILVGLSWFLNTDIFFNGFLYSKLTSYTAKKRGKYYDFDYREKIRRIVPYANLSSCDMKNDSLVCPDIRQMANSSLRHDQLVIIRMLRVFHLIAEKHKIRYWLTRGTLLAAVRDGVSIPWDTDCDICVPHEDFRMFVKYGVRDLPMDITLQTPQTDKHYRIPRVYNLMKLRDAKTDGYNFLDIFLMHMDEGGSWGDFSEVRWLARYLFGPAKFPNFDIFPLKEISFEGFKMWIPSNWGLFLETLYGKDYNNLPLRT